MIALFYQMKLTKKKTIDLDEYYHIEKKHNRGKTEDDLKPKCRICLNEGTASIYGNGNTTDMLEALQIFADIQISDDDGLPKHLCNSCLNFIKVAISFRKIAKQSDEILKQPVKEETFLESNVLQHDYDNEFETKEPEKWSKEEFNIIKPENKDKGKYNHKVTCHVCNKLLNRSYYKEHMTMHDPDHKKYICDVCGKSFRLRCAYHNHSLRHRTDFPHKCQYCPYRGRYSELLKTHMRTHTGDYRYMCTECPARFLFKSNLNSHMLKHKEPQFKCDACKRAFHTKLTMQRHYEADHLGIKNHVCNMCGKAFGYRNAMMKHQRHVHKREKMLYGRMPSYLQAEHRMQDDNL